MSRAFLILSLILLASCSSEKESRCYELMNAEFQEAIYSTHDFETDELKLDTVRVAFGDGHNISYYGPIEKDEARMQMYYDYEFDFEKDTSCFRTILNYELRGDSIRFFERRELPIVEKRIIKAGGWDYEILKVSWWSFSKTDEPNKATFLTSEFGIVAQLSTSQSQMLHSLSENKESQQRLNELIEALTNDDEFCSLRQY